MSDLEKKEIKQEEEELMKQEPEDLEFITHESVRDKSKMAEGEVIEDEMLSRKKTRRRSVDAGAAKVEKVQKIARKNLRMIIIGIAVVIVVICLLAFGVRRHMDQKAAENREQSLTEQEYEKDENEQVNELITEYYTCYAAGDTDSILKIAYPCRMRRRVISRCTAGMWKNTRILPVIPRPGRRMVPMWYRPPLR